MKVRKAVIPAAGLGTRLLPETKVVPKELLPIARRPLIHYSVEEAAQSGLETVVLVLPKDDYSIAKYFQDDATLEELLLRRGRVTTVAELRMLSQLAEVRTVFQDEPRGLADAIGCARSLIGDEPFAVILPDALIDSGTPCVQQLMRCYESYPGCVIATRQVDLSELGRYGILDLSPLAGSEFAKRVFRVNSLIERPNLRLAPSRFGIFGRYILDPVIFEFIDRTEPGLAGELQITDSLRLLSRELPVYAFCFEGRHYDAGDQLGMWQATIDYALRDPELGARLREHIANTVLGAVHSTS